MKMLKYITFIFCIISLVACKNNLMEEVDEEGWNHERNILDIKFEGQVGKSAVVRNGDDATVEFLFNVEAGSIDAVKISELEISYGSKASVSVGEIMNFDNDDKSATVIITSKKGTTLIWTIKLKEFKEDLSGTWKVSGLYVFGGTGPEYGGAAILKMSDKPWCWPSDGPTAEEDNILTFELVGVDNNGNTYGTFSNDAGADGLYADFRYILNMDVDVNDFYRKMPKGEGKWERDYSKGTVTFEFEDGTKQTSNFLIEGSFDVGYGFTRKVETPSFMFTLKGTDDWNNIYNDYDKFVANPRRFWVDMQKQ